MRNTRQFTPDEDAPLLLSWHRGDSSAFETLIWKYQKRIFNLALLLTGDPEAAAIATENSFLTAYQEIRNLTGRSHFSTWLVAITLKECRNLNDFRSAESSPSTPPSPASAHDITDIANPAALKGKLALCIKDLPVELAEVVLLRYVRGYSLDQMEDIFQIRPEIILSRLFEAEESLTACLKSQIYKVAPDLDDGAEDSTAPHPEIRRNFSAYLDSSVDNKEKEPVRSHLKSCGSCREALADLEWMIEHLKGHPDEEPPPLLTSSIMQKVNSTPGKPAEVRKTSRLTIQVSVGILLLAAIGLATYLLKNRDEIPDKNPDFPAAPMANTPGTHGKESSSRHPAPTSLPKGSFRDGGRLEDKKSPPPSLPAFPEALKQEAAPAALPSPILPPSGTEQLPAAGKPEQLLKREPAEAQPQLPAEWGTPRAPNRTPQKKAAPPRQSSDETAVVLTTSDPLAAGQEIEAAVKSLGGSITGRAYSSGNDILYTRIEVGKFLALMSRLGKIGKIKELPEPPDATEGMMELIVRW